MHRPLHIRTSTQTDPDTAPQIRVSIIGGPYARLYAYPFAVPDAHRWAAERFVDELASLIGAGELTETARHVDGATFALGGHE